MKKYYIWKGNLKGLNLGKEEIKDRFRERKFYNFIIMYVYDFKGKHMINFLNKYAIISYK